MLSQLQVRVAHVANPIEKPLALFASASPDLIARRQLLRRADTKFIVPTDTLPSLLSGLEDSYDVLRTGEAVIAEYRTLYFDSPSLDCLRDEQEGKERRYKVRIRHYPDRLCSFLELKCRDRERMNVKYRWQRPYGCDSLTANDLDDLATVRGDIPPLRPRLWSTFSRVTLLAREHPERVTIDSDVQFENRGETCQLGPLSIVEVKQSTPIALHSTIMRSLRTAGCNSVHTSKYGMGSGLFGIGPRG